MPLTRVPLGSGAADVAYDRTGTGPGLVLVHGTGATREQWLPLTEAVADRFTVVAPDYSGSGGTTDHGGPLTLADLADEVLAAADHAGLDRFHLVGHSLGAAIATHLAAHHPERVRSLVLHAGWAHTDSRLRAQFTYWLDLLHADAAHGTAHFARMLPLAAFGPRYWERTSTAANEELVRGLAAALAPGIARQVEVDLSVDLRPLLGRVTAPTLVLAGAHDQIIGADQQRALLAGIPDSRYQEIDAGHGAPGEDPAGFAALIAGFLDERRAAEEVPAAGAPAEPAVAARA
ncbi:alpha/beta hydrolase [Streptomyces sp. CB02959]|uniref:alpha/beta fold hydrolase n=1 Tax=Streptomyces sp. CB02959 TaxID=2020330 RepID=UPI000C27B0AA|nr:alpha/beta fold hydrolase [Streptomyces sp. CB02959]PJN40329.1 alpha/beta hydrolase [Streptomyces sp. CB02959]